MVDRWTSTGPKIDGTTWNSMADDVDSRLQVREGALTPFRFGAKLDGVTDDTAAMRATLQAVGDRGGDVLIPGLALVNGELGSYLKSGTTLRADTASRYWAYSTAVPPQGRGIRVGSAFTGTSLFPIPSGRQALSFRDLTLLGGNRLNTSGQPIHGFNGATTTSEQAWVGDNVGIIGFTGDGMRGHGYANRWSQLFIGGCGGWGINPTTYYADCHFTDGYIAGCKAGALNVDGTGSTGFTDFTNFRFERSGWDSSNINTPVGVGAPGVRLRRANNMRFVACSTDANSGHGLDLSLAANAGSIYDIDFIGFTFKRDGFGDMSTLGEYAAVRLAGIDSSGTRIDLGRVRFTACSTIHARATDGSPAAPSYLHPKYGLRMDRTANIQWVGGDIDSHSGGRVTNADLGNFRDSNFRPTIVMPQRGFSSPVARTRVDQAEGSTVWDSTLNNGAGGLTVLIGGVWRSPVTGAAIDGGATPTADTTPPTVAITSPANRSAATAPFTVTGTASDDVAVTQVLLLAGTETLTGAAARSGSTWSKSFDPTGYDQGAIVLRARANDAEGNFGTSAPVSVLAPRATGDNAVARRGFDYGVPALSAVDEFDTSEGSVTYSVSAAAGGAGLGVRAELASSTRAYGGLSWTSGATVAFRTVLSATATTHNAQVIRAIRADGTVAFMIRRTNPDRFLDLFTTAQVKILKDTAGASYVAADNAFHTIEGVVNTATGAYDIRVWAGLADGSGTPAATATGTATFGSMATSGAEVASIQFGDSANSASSGSIGHDNIAVGVSLPLGSSASDTTPPTTTLTAPAGGSTTERSVTAAGGFA